MWGCSGLLQGADELGLGHAAAALDVTLGRRAEAIDESLAERPHADLRRAATIQLNRCGASAIDVSEHCTWDDRDFFSHRRDVTHGGASTTGRQGAVIACRATSTTP